MPFSPEQKSILQSGAESDQELTTEQVPGVGADEFHRDGAYKNSEALSGANEHHIYGAYRNSEGKTYAYEYNGAYYGGDYPPEAPQEVDEEAKLTEERAIEDARKKLAEATEK